MGEWSYDGSPMQAGTSRGDFGLTGQRSEYSITSLRVMVVVARYYVDQPQNRSKRYVEYTCRDLYTSKLYPRCRQLSAMSGLNDGDDNTLRSATTLLPSATGAVGKFNQEQSPAADTDADQVLVGFIDGSSRRPVIVGVLRHSASKYGATAMQGERRLTQHKGTTIEIQKDGQYVITHKSGSVVQLLTSGDVQVKPAAGKDVFIGDTGATENLVLGQQFKTFASNLIDALLTASYPTGVGPTGPMLPPSATTLTSLKTALDTLLSDMAFTQKEQT